MRTTCTSCGPSQSRSTHGEAGFTILELVLAISVFAVFAIGFVETVKTGIGLARSNRDRDVAANLASQEMDLVRSSSFTSLPLGLVQTPQTVGGVHYTVNRESEWVASNASAGACDSAGQTPALLRVHISVTWTAMEGTAPVVSDTVLTPPVGAYNPNTGHIAVKVKDRNAAPSSGDPVTVTGPGVNRTIATTSDGCAFFDHLAVGAYSVSLGRVGFVDRQSNPSPAQTAGVLAGAVTAVGFDYDQAATVTVMLAPDGGAALPVGVPVSLGNTIFVPNGIKLYVGSGLTRTVPNLFPATDGYDAWVGDCADADPEGRTAGGGPYWPGAQRPTATGTSPGGTATVTLPVPSLTATVTQSGLPAAGRTVTAVHAADAGCGAGETLTLGTTDGSGLVTAALPYGTWSIRVSGASPSGSWPSAVVDPSGSPSSSVSVTVQ
ncbi:MAG: type II secretion system protein [Acidimicrobiia bacterium]